MATLALLDERQARLFVAERALALGHGGVAHVAALTGMSQPTITNGMAELTRPGRALNDRVLPFYEAEGIPLLRILTDRGTEYCGNVERHEYQLFLALADIEHTRTKAKSPQTNGICERFHKTELNEFYRIAFRKKIYRTIEELQVDLDAWLDEYNHQRPHQGKRCDGRTPYVTLTEAKEIVREKMIAV